mmetsp:Transcript_48285/g.112995  ORF Transcript_48285/g.112995 Transcript_48285/m.112995 type:complete len:110 (+) Transcript_48285:32-361(+)
MSQQHAEQRIEKGSLKEVEQQLHRRGADENSPCSLGAQPLRLEMSLRPITESLERCPSTTVMLRALPKVRAREPRAERGQHEELSLPDRPYNAHKPECLVSHRMCSGKL